MGLETRTNNDFEAASRRSFSHLTERCSYLTEQVQVLKDAFNKLSDGLLEELEMIGQRFSQRLDRVDSDLSEKDSRFERLLIETTKKHEGLIESQENLSRDVDTLLDVIPKLENKVDAVKKDMDGLSLSINDRLKDGDSHHGRFEAQLRRMDLEWEQRLGRQETALREELREDMEQRTLQLQRSISRQMENMSKVLQDTSLSSVIPSTAVAPPAPASRPDQARHDALEASARLMESMRVDAERFDAVYANGRNETLSASKVPAEPRATSALPSPSRLEQLRNLRLS